MPHGDEKHELILEELVSILGEDYVEDDLSIIEAVYRDALTPSYASKGRVEFIVLPGSTEDIQQIMRLANRLRFPVSVTSTGMLQATCNAVQGYPYWCYVDLKRLNRFEIDPDNMLAVIEPYVSIAQLQAETMKYGLFHGVTGASSQASVMGTNLFHGVHWTNWRTGAGRNMLGVEWVLPNGDLLRTGSLAIPGAGCFWGEGPGPDARGILRGFMSHLGSLGVITRMAVKLYPWPGPSIWPTEGVQPEKRSSLPPEDFQSFFISFPTLRKAVDAIAAMGKAEIAGWVLKFCAWDFVCWYTRSFEEFWAEWNSEFWKRQRESRFLVAVGLWGFASPKQVQYEKKVLLQIVEEFDGELVPEEIHRKLDACLTPNAIRETHRNRFTRLGRPAVTGGTVDSLYDTLRSARVDKEVQRRYTPPLGDTGPDIKFWPIDFGHVAATEVDVLAEKSPEFEGLEEKHLTPDQLRAALDTETAPTVTVGFLNRLGPHYDNAHRILRSIKKALDPNNIANPTRMIDMQASEEGGKLRTPLANGKGVGV